MGLEPGVTMAQVRSKWKELARRYHPDHNPDDPLAESHFKDVQEAYRILSDEVQRRRYDQGALDQLWSEMQPVNHYFFARCEPKSLKSYEEINLIFTYSGQGRVFIKPEMPDFLITGSPFVSQRMVMHEGQAVRETELTYVVSPLKTGRLEIGKARISINHRSFDSEPITVSVTSNFCRFSKDNPADGEPYKLTLHFEYLPGEEPFRMSELKKNHVLLVPRSKNARLFHRIGSGMKLVGTIWGMIKLNQEYDLNLLAGMVAGNIFAGFNCYILYAIAQIKPKFSAPSIYSLAKEYRERGYYLGESKGIPFITGNFWYYLGRLFL